MADIDEIVARAQRGGEFGARRNFTLESSRAFKKMRKFALPNPHHYILELLQGAVANGAEYLDIALEKELLRVSYTGSGSGFTAQELEGIFDALFSSQDSEEDADIRGLAMAFNTLYSLGFSRIVVESGDGTLKGSSRLEIAGDTITIGDPSAVLRGTFVIVEGGDRDPKVEEQLLLDRCISSNIPICLNGKFLFSSRGEKFPMPFGYRRCTRFDEGDLYGTIGVNTLQRDPSLKIMVNGVHLWSFAFPSNAGAENLGGIVCFNRLRKTVDHADVVRDEIWDELWGRLAPYRDYVLGKTTAVVPSRIEVIGDPWPTLLRNAKKRLEGAETLILVEPEASEFEKGRASVIADLLGGLPVLVPKRLVSVMAGLVPRHVPVIAPALKDASVMGFFNRDFATTPTGVGAKLSLPPLRLNDYASHDLSEEYAGSLPGTRIEGALYYAGNSRTAPNGVQVRFIAFGRLLWEGLIESVHRGVYLEVFLPSITPAQLERQYGAVDLASQLIAAWEAKIRAYLEDELALLLEAGVEPLTAGAHTALSRLESGYTLGFKQSRGRLRPGFRCWTNRGSVLSKLPVFRTLTGERIGLEALPKLMEKNAGLVYGVRAKEGSLEFAEFVPLEGLDRERILLVDEATENALMTLVGAAGYVRVDRRDILAEAGGFALRDVALGLRDYPQELLLVEWDPEDLVAAKDVRLHQESLLDQLIGPVKELIESASSGLWARPSADACEWLRQATRHLQWAAIHADEIGLPPEKCEELMSLKLFVTVDNSLVTMRQVMSLPVVPVLEGLSQDLVQVAMDSHVTAVKEVPDDNFVLTMNPFVIAQLEGKTTVTSAVAHERLLPRSSVMDGAAIVTYRPRGNVRGTVGVAPEGTDPVVLVTRPGAPAEAVSGEIFGLRIFGQLHLAGATEVDEALVEIRGKLLSKLEEAASSLTEKGLESTKREILAIALLRYVSAHMRWEPRQATVRLHITDDAANRILDLPILRLKGDVSTTPARVLHTMQAAPSVTIAISDWHSDAVQAWVKNTQDQLWDVLVANRMRFEEDRPSRKADYAGEVVQVFEIAGLPPKPAPKPSSTVPRRAIRQVSAAKLRERFKPLEAQAPPKRVEPVVAQTGGTAWAACTRAAQVQEWRDANDLNKKLRLAPAKVSKSYPVLNGRLVTDDNIERLRSFPKPPWETGNAVVGVEQDGRINPRFLAPVLEYWIHELSEVKRKRELLTVHFRTMQRGPLGGLIERITPDFPDLVRWHEPPEDKTLRLGSEKYESTRKDWVVRAYAEAKPEEHARLAVVFNYGAHLVLAATRSVADLERLFPTLLLAAYSAANYRFTSIHAGHEEEFQRAVLDLLLEEKPFFTVGRLNGTPEHGLVAG